MGWVTVRYALAHILPGLFPTLVLFYHIEPTRIGIIGEAFGQTSAYVLMALFVGAGIELIRPYIQGTWIFTSAPNPIRWSLGMLKSVCLKIRGTDYSYHSLAWLYQDYKRKEEAMIRFWLELQIKRQGPDFQEAIKKEGIVKDQYIEPKLITTGDRWALLIVLENNCMKFMVDEYFSYYQFAFNFWISIMLTAALIIFLFIVGEIYLKTTLYIIAALILFYFTFHFVTMYWWLATSRFIRKLLVHSSVKQ